MSKFKVNIPKPCNENWNKMLPKGNGKFCFSCEKTVVDFTKMETKDIQAFFKENEETKVCGHYRISQTTKSIGYFDKTIISLYEWIETKFRVPLLRSFCLFFLSFIMFCVGCQNRTTGKTMSKRDRKAFSTSEQRFINDSLLNEFHSKEPTLTGEGVPFEIKKDSVRPR